MVHAYFNSENAEAFKAVSTKTDSKFEIFYFGLHGLAFTTRTILAISGADFKTTAPAEGTWVPKYKPLTPFGVMPVLRETSADGKHVLNLSESDAIDRYLSRKFGYLGQNAYEEMIINSFVSSSQSISFAIVQKYLTIRDNPELKAENKTKLLAGPVPDWIRYHETHLSENEAAVRKGEKHGNGHYVGESFSMADVKTLFVMNLIRGMTGDDLITKEKTPALWKVKENIEAKESHKAWAATEDYKAISEQNLKVLGF